MPIIHSEDAEVKSLYPGFDARFMVDRDHGSQAVTIIDEIFHPGVLIPLHRHKVEGSCFVYAGTGILKIDGEEPHRLEPGMGVLVPANTWHSLENDGKEDLRWITAFPAVDVMREMKGEEQPASTIFQEKDIQPREIFPGVSLVQAVDYDHGSQAITMGKITIEPGCEIPPHTHPVDDAMIILSGSGELYTTEGSVPIETDSHGWAPANTRHGVRNTGKQPLVFIYTWPAANVARIMKK